MKKQKDPRYSKDGLPPVKNIFSYFYFSIMKLILCFIFGTGGLTIGILVFPFMKLFLHPANKFKKYARRFISLTFRFFILLMRISRCIRLNIEHKEAFKNLSSKIIVANHPSLLDIVFLISLMPNADCIVRGGLSKGIYGIIIRQLYLVNTLGFEEMYTLASKSLSEGNNLIIFPEGTRTPRHGVNKFKRGAARIAYETNSDIQPVYIGGNDKYGLGKHDAFISFNREESYLYDIKLLPTIEIKDYKDLESQIAARKLTDKIHKELAAEAFLYDNKII